MIEAWLESAVGMVWNYPVVGLCLLAGIFFTLRMAFIQLRCLPHALALISGKYDNPNEPGQITHFQALSAALSGTIGLGNIAGVAIAIAMGGPGAVLWMWIIAFLGMATKYVECALGTMYRDVDPETKKTHGGPMLYIVKGLGKRWTPLAIFFAICTAIGSFGFACMFQANQVASAMTRYYGIPDWITGAVLAFIVALTILGGIKRIGKVASKVVPAMCGAYLIAALAICVLNVDKIPDAFWVIFTDAFTGTAAAGGIVGTVVIIGVRRAIFSNEAGLGSAPIAHAAVKTDYPIREGIVASLGPLIDTIVVCTCTALVIVLAGNYGSERYEAYANRTLDLQSSEDIQLSGAWKLQSSGVPELSNRLQEFRTGDSALVLGGNSPESSATTRPMSVFAKGRKGILHNNLMESRRKVADGLRFSSFIGAPSQNKNRVELLDENGALLASLKIQPDGDEVEWGTTASGLPIGISLSHSNQINQWESLVLLFSKGFKEAVQGSDFKHLRTIQLRFVGGEGAGAWFLDRIQAIKELEGVALTTTSFDKYLDGVAGLLIAIAIFFFCYSTMITWSYYGETASSFVFGEGVKMLYKLLFVIAVFVGAVTKLTIVLNFSDLMSGLMVIPNTIAILLLSPIVVRETREYFIKLKKGEFDDPTQINRVALAKED